VHGTTILWVTPGYWWLQRVTDSYWTIIASYCTITEDFRHVTWIAWNFQRRVEVYWGLLRLTAACWGLLHTFLECRLLAEACWGMLKLTCRWLGLTEAFWSLLHNTGLHTGTKHQLLLSALLSALLGYECRRTSLHGFPAFPAVSGYRDENVRGSVVAILPDRSMSDQPQSSNTGVSAVSLCKRCSSYDELINPTSGLLIPFLPHSFIARGTTFFDLPWRNWRSLLRLCAIVYLVRVSWIDMSF
jgi:hypothetical protein